MSLFDTMDGCFMNFAYGWAFSRPIRKVYYNIVITTLSVAIALFIGTIELFGLLGEELGLRGAVLELDGQRSTSTRPDSSSSGSSSWCGRWPCWSGGSDGSRVDGRRQPSAPGHGGASKSRSPPVWSNWRTSTSSTRFSPSRSEVPSAG